MSTVRILISWLRTRYIRSFLKMTAILHPKLYARGDNALLENVKVVYKSPNYIIVDKDYDVMINSNDPIESVTVATQLRYCFPDLWDHSMAHGFRFCHRLDYATSGVLCLALNKKAAAKVQKAFQNHTTTKHYLALVRGHVMKPDVVINVSIGRDSTETEVNKMCTIDSPGCTGSRSAESRIIRLEWGIYDGQPATKVLLLLYTGRTHQLRVHCKHVGHCIVGDYTYSNRQDTEPYRMMLHAYRLTLPLTQEHIDITTKDPFLADVDEKWHAEKVFTTYKDFFDMEDVGQSSKDFDRNEFKTKTMENDLSDKSKISEIAN